MLAWTCSGRVTPLLRASVATRAQRFDSGSSGVLQEATELKDFPPSAPKAHPHLTLVPLTLHSDHLTALHPILTFSHHSCSLCLICPSTYTRTHTHTCTYTRYIYTCLLTCPYIYIHLYKHTRAKPYTHTHMHIYIDTYMYSAHMHMYT